MNIREVWVHPLHEDRIEKGEFYTLYPDLRHYPLKFFNSIGCSQIRLFIMQISTFFKKQVYKFKAADITRTDACFNTQVTDFPICTIAKLIKIYFKSYKSFILYLFLQTSFNKLNVNFNNVLT